jgi:Mor family transcriptional regulator
MDIISIKEIRKMWKERRTKIYKEHLAGASYNDLAKKYDVAASRIGQIIEQEEDYVSTTKD